ncbi:MAG: glycosyltransferase family 4 protein [Syntrophaceae bacterium]|nr:glycosyltransferase family 4 protein [Syntrophaceae bacterium]
MKIAFVTTRPDKASFRFRVVQYLPYIEQKGLKYDILILPRDFWSRRQFFNQLKAYNVVFWQKRLLGGWDLWQLRRNCQYLIYDFDDSVMYNDAKDGKFISRRLARRLENMVKTADRVIAGNEFLEEQAKLHTSERKITRIPSVVDLNLWKSERHEPQSNQNIIVGWVGSQSTLPYWMEKLSLWKSISRKYPNVIFKVICDDTEKTFSAPQYKDFRFQATEWTEPRQVEDCNELDIGLMPLPDNLWTRGKCGFKLIQYLSLAKAAVASPVGVNNQIVIHDKTGLLADSDEDWIHGLSELIEDQNRRIKLGEAGFLHVKENYSLEAWVDRFCLVLQRN